MVELNMGTAVFVLDWAAVVFSIAATLFWAVTTCCCSGRSANSQRNIKDRKIDTSAATSYTAFGPRGYKPLDDQEESLLNNADKKNDDIELKQHTKAASGPFNGREGAYEPLRHAQV
jgi:hypothetical protein